MASRGDFSVSKCACVMAYQSSRLQTLESMVTRNLFQHPKHQYARDFMLIKLISETCKVGCELNWLQA